MNAATRTLKDYAPQIKAVVVTPSTHLGGLLRDLMQFTIGAPDVVHARSLKEALEILLERRCNLLLLDVSDAQKDALSLIREIRKGHGKVPREVPIVAMMQAPTRALVEQLRDLGVNEILAIPVTAGHLTDRLKSVFEKPRDWVFTERYVGPDRRRKKNEFAGGERRGPKDDPTDDALTLTDTVDASAKPQAES